MSRAVQEVRRAIASKFGRHNSPRRAPTRGAPTNCQSFSDKEPGSSRQRRREIATTHYDLHSSRRFGLGRAPTRGAPTDCFLSAFGPGKGTHKGCPYRLFSSARRAPLAWGRAPTRGAPTDCFLSAFWPGEGTHKGRPYGLFSLLALGRAPTRGAPTDCFLASAFWPGEGTTRGAPTDCFLSAFWPGEGAHKGRPYPIQAASRGFSNLMQLPCGGARRRFLGGCCLKQDLQDFWGFSGLRSSG